MKLKTKTYRRIIATAILGFITMLSAWSQTMKVQSFRALPTDLTARVTAPVEDQNGEKAALLKIVTIESGFVFDGGILGIVKTVQKEGEIWVYLPPKARKITIKHQRFGVLRDYAFPISVQGAATYEMVLSIDIPDEKATEVDYQWLTIDSEPQGATVYLNGKASGITPVNRKFRRGVYTMTLNKPFYEVDTSRFVLNIEKVIQKRKLNPNFGSLKITSPLKEGFNVMVDGNQVDSMVPSFIKPLAPGKHRLDLVSKWFEPRSYDFELKRNDTAVYHLDPVKVYTTLKVDAMAGAQIYSDGEYLGSAPFNGRILRGIYTIEARMPKFHTATKQIEVDSLIPQSIKLEMRPILANVDITSDPYEATVWVDGKNMGTTPLSLEKLPLKSYHFKLDKAHFGVADTTIEIDRDTMQFNFRLEQFQELTVKSDVDSVSIYQDGKFEGVTPITFWVKPGIHKIAFAKNGYVGVEKTFAGKDRGEAETIESSLDKMTYHVQFLASEAGAPVNLNGVNAGVTPFEIDLATGRYKTTIGKGPAKRQWSKTFSLPGADTVFYANLDELKRKRKGEAPIGLSYAQFVGSDFIKGKTYTADIYNVIYFSMHDFDDPFASMYEPGAMYESKFMEGGFKIFFHIANAAALSFNIAGGQETAELLNNNIFGGAATIQTVKTLVFFPGAEFRINLFTMHLQAFAKANYFLPIQDPELEAGNTFATMPALKYNEIFADKKIMTSVGIRLGIGNIVKR